MYFVLEGARHRRDVWPGLFQGGQGFFDDAAVGAVFLAHALFGEEEPGKAQDRDPDAVEITLFDVRG